MKVKMELLSDAIFGNGMSVPGAEDISVLCDDQGFPFYKGGTFKGVFREELERYLELTGAENAEETISRMLGQSGDHDETGKMIFSDFTLAARTRQKIWDEVKDPYIVTDITTHLRTFTAMETSGVVKDGSLRLARCVDKGLCFYSDITCSDKDINLIRNVLGMTKWIGSLRNRGFGKIAITIMDEEVQQ